jgi:hypothetical protein
MLPNRPAEHSRTWIAVAILSLAVSAVAVAVVRWSSGGPELGELSHLAESFASPGEFLWWATLGGAFAGYPTGFSGHLIWVVGTAAFWFSAATTLITTLVRLRRSFGSHA